jgi:3'-5' exoribonuclease
MLSKTFIADLVLDTHIQSTFLASAKATRQTKYGDPYLCVTLTDRTGSVEARAWENADMLAARFDADDFVLVSAAVTSYQDTLQLKLQDIELVDESQVEIRDFMPTSRWEGEALFAQLKDLVLTEVASAPMRNFFKTLFGQEELMRRFKLAPAAKANHHNYIGGLLEHVLSMTRQAVMIADHYARYYPGMLNKDLLMAGCVMHDIGKCRELSFTRSFAYTTHGQLIGHIPHGVEIVNDIVAQMHPTPPEEMIIQIKHLILSHHGRLEYGSPVTPRTPEAMLLHEIDMIDSRMAMVHNILASHSGPEEGPDRWTDYHRALQTRVYIGGEHDAIWRARPEFHEKDLVGPGMGHPDLEHEQHPQAAHAQHSPQAPAPARDVDLWKRPEFAANQDRDRASGDSEHKPRRSNKGSNLDLFNNK